jgi:hypothetical protein
VRIRVKEALQEYGVTSDSVQQGDNAWSSGFHELTAKQKEMVSAGWGFQIRQVQCHLVKMACSRGGQCDVIKRLYELPPKQKEMVI